MVGQGPVRTGVTVIVPHDAIGDSPVFAGCHTLNGNGEMTGLEWIRESGQLTTPVAITNTHSVGIVRDALVAADMATRSASVSYWSLPVVAETYDGGLNDINGMHVTAAQPAPGVGRRGERIGARGQRRRRHRHGLSRIQGWHGHGVAHRERLARRRARAGELRRPRAPHDRRRAGRSRAARALWSHRRGTRRWRSRGAAAGSIIVILATDAPILPHQLTRLAQRAGLGIARMGGSGAHSSGDIFLAFSTANGEGLHSYKSGGAERRVLGDDAAGRGDVGPVLGRDRGDRGGDLQRVDRRADDGWARRHHGARAAARRAGRDHDATTAAVPHVDVRT